MSTTREVNSIGFLGPAGSFTQEALLSQSDLSQLTRVAFPSMADVLQATASGEVDYGFLPIENSIEGTVLVTLDSLVFDYDLLIQREVALPIHQNLLTIPNSDLTSIDTIYSHPQGSAQCRKFITSNFPQAKIIATTSTSEAARQVASSQNPRAAAIGPKITASLYGLELQALAIEDFAGNTTRFVLLHSDNVPLPTRADKTTIVCFQLSDRPGSLVSILAQFAARNINLTKLESRPSKNGLGEYCFVIDLQGHIGDAIVSDCLFELKNSLAQIKFLGSYPAASGVSNDLASTPSEAALEASKWLKDITERIGRLP